MKFKSLKVKINFYKSYIMEQQRFKKRKKTNYKRGLFLVILLVIILYLWMNTDGLITSFFGVKK